MLQKIYGATDQHLILLDKQFNLLFIENSLKKLYGFTSDVKGESFLDLCKKHKVGACFTKKQFEIISSKLGLTEDFNRAGVLRIDWQVVPIRDDDIELVISGYSVEAGSDEGASSQTAGGMNAPLEYIINHVPHFIFWKDINSVFIGCNKVFAETAGLSDPKEIMGKTDYDLPWKKEESDAYREDDQQVINSGKAKLNIEETQTFSDGTKITLLTSKVPLINFKGEITGVLGIYTDISYIKRTEESLRNAKDDLEEANKSKSEFIANMSHDIRTPVSGILGMAEILEKRLISKENKEYSKALAQSAHELLCLLEDIMSVFELESGSYVNTLSDFDLKELVNHNLRLLYPTAHNKHNKLTFVYKIDSSIKFKGVETSIDRILLNLLSNAIKFTDRGEIEVRVKLLENQNGNARVQITVSDQGLGIPKDKYEVIFSYLSRLTPSYEGKYKGHGIGLYQVKKLLENMSGSISVRSVEGAGSVFKIVLPLKLADLYSEKDYQLDTFSSEAHKVSAGKYGRILLVEDDDIALNVAKHMLAEHHESVDAVRMGQTAINLAEESKYDLIYLDIGLPDMSGIDVAKWIRENNGPNQSVPIIALTGHLAKTFYKKCKTVGINYLISKPLMEKDINAVINVFLLGEEGSELNSSSDKVDSESKATIDLKLGGKLIGGDEDLAKDMLTRLYKVMKTQKFLIEKAYQEKDHEQLKKLIHKIYGGILYCGVPRLLQVTNDFHTLLNARDYKSKDYERLYFEFTKEADAFVDEYHDKIA